MCSTLWFSSWLYYFEKSLGQKQIAADSRKQNTSGTRLLLYDKEEKKQNKLVSTFHNPYYEKPRKARGRTKVIPFKSLY